MVKTNKNHRPLLSGIWVTSAGMVDGALKPIESGTLTAVATRNSDNKKVLVTCKHVMTGSNLVSPSGDEGMYQEEVPLETLIERSQFRSYTPSSDSKVGTAVGGLTNPHDVAMCLLEEGDDGVTADSIMHDLPQHSSRHIVGVMDAWVDKENRDNKMELIMLGARSGEIKVKVSSVDQPTPGTTSWLDGLVYLDCRDNPVSGSDSGAPCFSKVSETEYKLVCIMFANFNSNYAALAIPASTVEKELGITFGSPAPDLVPVPPAPEPIPPTVNRPPIADAGPDQTVDSKELVYLNGTRSADGNEGDVLAYSWRQLPGVGGHTVILGHVATSEPFFIAPVGPAELFFELTVTDRTEATDTDKVKITVNAPPTPTPNPDAGSDTDTDSGSDSGGDGDTGIDTDTTVEPPVTPWQDTGMVRGSGANREKEQVRYNNITGDFETQWVSDPEPTPTPTPTPDPTPPPQPVNTWVATGNTRGCGPAYEYEESLYSGSGALYFRWVSAPQPETWGAWSDTGETMSIGGGVWVKEQSRTSNCGNTETQWVQL